MQRLTAQHGELLSGAALSRALGYRTQRAFQMGLQRNQVPVHTFTLPGRKGRFARTADVARWLATCDLPDSDPGMPAPPPTG